MERRGLLEGRLGAGRSRGRRLAGEARKPMGDRVIRAAFWAASVICLVDLNDLTWMFTGVTQVFSAPLLLCCLVMLMGLFRVRPMDALGWPGVLVLSALASYCGLGIAAAFVLGVDFELDSGFYLVRHAGSFVLILAVAVGGRVVLASVGDERALRGLLVVLTGSCVLMIASPLLMEVLENPPREAEYRLFGSFTDPNMAALVASFGVVSALALLASARVHLVAYGALPAMVTALVGTFSRTALVALPFLVLGAVLSNRGRARTRLLWGLALLAGVVGLAAQRVGVPVLDVRQLRRWESLLQIVELSSIDDVTLAGRLTLWELALDKALDAPVFGLGLGSLHRLEDAWYNTDGVLLGAHNQYLVLLGEAGFVPLVLFVGYLGLVLWAGWRNESDSRVVSAAAGCVMVVAIFSIAFHGILTQRACNFMMGLSCAAVASCAGRQRRPGGGGGGAGTGG